ncbi:hypothetical protein T484DRAFT_1826503 [Baffinella frigidus]|nr:hypothetical protein T484DRAFT_1826503 [Cryptophyta sp. CCMP2293]
MTANTLSQVEQFGATATIVTVIDAIVNALLNLILIVMTVNLILILIVMTVNLSLILIVMTVVMTVVACRLALALPRSTGKKLYVYYKAEHLKLSALGDEQAEKDLMMAEEDPGVKVRSSLEGLQDMMAIKFGRSFSNESRENSIEGGDSSIPISKRRASVHEGAGAWAERRTSINEGDQGRAGGGGASLAKRRASMSVLKMSEMQSAAAFNDARLQCNDSAGAGSKNMTESI